MTHQQFKERLEEITRKVAIMRDPRSEIEAQESLITLFEDYTKEIVGEEENGYELGVISGEKYARRLRNLFRQTINQTSKTILKGESDERD